MVNKKRLGIMLLFSLATSLIVGCTNESANESTLMKKDTWTEKELKAQKEIKYEILDKSVLTEADMKSWYEKSYKEKGVHFKSDKEHTYIVVSDGKKATSGYGIELFDVRKANEDIVIGYNVIKPDKNKNVEKKENYPHLILRIEAEKGKVIGKQIK
ncbi:protease complex subunit PrcB family protein [Bacillus sp. NPDC094106]|uniref:protease complex subunit PrcB family protein n=1 Tax=Bacillus sp. NPDC094106 TaxID=3363949 RepID=UPI00380336B0